LDGIFLNPTPKSVVATVLRELVVFFEKRFFPINFVDAHVSLAITVINLHWIREFMPLLYRCCRFAALHHGVYATGLLLNNSCGASRS